MPSIHFRQPDDIFQLRVSLLEVEPPIWRRLLVPQDKRLPSFHSILQAVMGWNNSHLHQFKVAGLCFAESTLEYEPGPIDHKRITLNQILPGCGATCIYEYDFGDGWEHLIEVEAEVPNENVTVHVPRCLGGERACPPDDCGGPHGYAHFVEAIRDSEHEEHNDYVQWLGGAFDPEAFDLGGVNRTLSRLAARSPRIRRHRQ